MRILDQLLSLSALPLLLLLPLTPSQGAVRSLSVADIVAEGADLNGAQVEVKGFLTYSGAGVVNMYDTDSVYSPMVAVHLDQASADSRKYLLSNCSDAKMMANGGKLPCAVYVLGRVDVTISFLSIYAKSVSTTATVAPGSKNAIRGEPIGDTSCLMGAQFGVPLTNALTVAQKRAESRANSENESIAEHRQRLHDEALRREYDKAVGILRPAGDVSTTPPNIGITRTPLSCFFARHPYQDSGTNWPRVAITIVSAPPFWGELVQKSRDIPANTCWSMKAKIWFNQKDAQDVAPFQWCWSEMSLGVQFNDVPTWGGHASYNMMDAIRGGARTEGPWAPSAPLPDDPMNRDKFSFMTYSNYFVGSVLHRMGLNWSKSDGRVWFNLGF